MPGLPAAPACARLAALLAVLPQGGGPQIVRLAGKKIVAVKIAGLRRLPPAVVRHLLRTRQGAKLSTLDVRRDIEMLWRRFKLRAVFKAREVEGGVEVLVEAHEFRTYGKLEFRGLDHFSEKQVRRFLDIKDGEKQTELSGNNLARLLEERYRDDGFPFVRVELVPEPKEDKLVLEVDEGPEVTVRSLTFRGNEAFPATTLFGIGWSLVHSAKVKSSPGWFFLADAAYSEKTLEQDLQRLRNFYRERGYLDARVELEDRRFTEDLSEVDLVIRVFEGPLYHVSKVDLQLLPPEGAKETLFAKEDLVKVLRLRPGEPIEKERLDRDEAALAAFYGRRGFPRRSQFPLLERGGAFDVLEPLLIADPKTAAVQVVYRVREGRRMRVRDVRITGNTSTRDAVIRRQISVYPGDLLDVVELKKSEDRLRALQYFGKATAAGTGVRVDLKPVEGSKDLVDVEVGVEEGNTGQFLWGVGISSANGFFGSIRYRKRNFDWRRPPTGWNPIDWFGQILTSRAFHGGGQDLNILFAPGFEVSQFLFSFYEPDVFVRHLDPIGLRLIGHRTLRIFDTYDRDVLGASVGLERSFGRTVRASLRLRQERVRISDIDAAAPAVVWDAEGKHEIRSLRFGTSLDLTDSKLRPTHGLTISGYGEIAPQEIGGQVHFWKAGVRASVYVPLFRDSSERAHVLRIRNWLEGGGPLGRDRDLFLSERYFLGGQNTLRGFDFRGAGPTQFGNPTGGRLRWIGGLEYGFPIWARRLAGSLEQTEFARGVVFLDAGALGDRFGDARFDELRLSWGVGLRILIPHLGVPVAFDVAWPLRREATDDTRIFHFSFRY